jgi:hypothetical protein
MFLSKYIFFVVIFIFYSLLTAAQGVPSQAHLQHVKRLFPVWKNLDNKTDTIPIHSTNNKKLVLFHAFTLDSIQPNLSLFFLGIVGKCEVYVNQALIWKGEDKYGKLLVNLPYSNLKKLNVIQIRLYPKHHQKENIIGLFQDVYLVNVSPERASLTPPKYSSYKDTVALLYPYSYLEGFRGNKTLMNRQLMELKKIGIEKIKFLLPPPDYAYSICDSLDIFIIDNTENSLHKFYFNTVPPILKNSLLEYFAWYNESYTKTKYYQSVYRADAYILPEIKYNIKINLWLLSCILIGYLVFLKISFKDIISDFYDWFRRYRLIMETVKNKKLIPAIWVNLLVFFYWMIISAVLVYITVSYTFVERSVINQNVYYLLHNNLIWIFLLWLIFIFLFAITHLISGVFVSLVSQLYGRSKIFIRITEISLINHFPILYFVTGILFVLPLSPYILEYINWAVLYLTLFAWVVLRLYRMYRFGTKGLKLHDIVIILYLCGAEVLPFFLLGFYIFNF